MLLRKLCASFVFSLLFALTACARTATQTPIPTAVAIATNTIAHTATATPQPTATATLQPTDTPTSTPTTTPMSTLTPTSTSTPTPLPMPILHSIDIGGYPRRLFSERTWIQVSDNYIQSSSPDLGSNTIVERLPNYPGFNGPVIHVNVNGPPAEGQPLQHAFIETERVRGKQLIGDWGYEVSLNVLKAPINLDLNVWDVAGGKGRVISLASLLMHPSEDSEQFYAFGGVFLRDRVVNGDRQYFVSMYDVYHGNANPDRQVGIPFEIGKKQRLRVEVYYDMENNNRPTIRGFLQTGDGKWKVIGKRVLTDLEERKWKIEGDITWVGLYPSRGAEGCEVIAGEAVVYRK